MKRIIIFLISLFLTGSAFGQLNGEWTNLDGGAYNSDYGNGVAVDSSGNAIVVGFVTEFPDNSVIYKYAPDGTTLWSKKWSYTSAADALNAVDVDQNDNIYVVGYRANTSDDLIVFKLSPTGVIIWSNIYDGGYADRGYGITVKDSSLYVCGSRNNGSDTDIVVIKYSTAGNSVWTNFFNSGAGNDVGNGIDTDTAGNVFVGGGWKCPTFSRKLAPCLHCLN